VLYAVRQRQEDTVKSLLDLIEIRGSALFNFVCQYMSDKEIDVDILRLLVQHDPSIVGMEQ
jgi:hypothetical protein